MPFNHITNAEVAAKRKEAPEILTKAGFSKVNEEKNNEAFDFTAEKDGRLCFVEVKTRHPDAKTQFFTYRDSQLRHLSELTSKGPVFLLLINKDGSRIVPLEDVLSNSAPGVYVFKYKKSKAIGTIGQAQIPMGEAGLPVPLSGKQPWPRERKKEIWTTAADVKEFNDVCFERKVCSGELLNHFLRLYEKYEAPRFGSEPRFA